MTPETETPSLFDRLDSCWLGLSTDNRRLFDALQDGWFHPIPPNTGVILGIGKFAREESTAKSVHRIPIRVKLNAAKLPDLEVAIFQSGEWRHDTFRRAQSLHSALVFWPGVLPTFAISELTVPTEEERKRLTGLARHVSNVEISDVPVVVRVVDDEVGVPVLAPPEPATKLAIPPDGDSIHGAMNMAFWAIPRIGPWLDVLSESLSSDRSRLPDLANGVDASWWRFPPWAQCSKETGFLDAQECFWLAAMDVFRAQSFDQRGRTRELADEIASTILHYRSSDNEVETEPWLRLTRSILRAETTIQFERWRSCPVGTAIQLVLTRPDPVAFKSWFRDRPDMPPAIAWSGAVLCGLLSGYRMLDSEFRGEPSQREAVAIRSLDGWSETLRDIRWPHHHDDKPNWREEDDCFVLSWDGIDIARKQMRERGRWHAADFDDVGIQREAGAVAKLLDWQCFGREITLTEGQIRISGPGRISVSNKRNPNLAIRGKVTFQLPDDATLKDIIHVDSFRRLIATEFGRIPAPPPAHISRTPVETMGIQGLEYVRDFLSENDESAIVKQIDQGNWSEEFQRRVQHYGWRYDYKAGQVDPAMRLGPLPRWADDVARRLVKRGLMSSLPDQVIVNEYVRNQGIAPHVDSESFGDDIAMISLLESWEMVFRERRGKQKFSQRLEQRSVAIIKGEARYSWTHEIPKRKTEPGVVPPGKNKPIRVPRNRRISLTFRKVIDAEE